MIIIQCWVSLVGLTVLFSVECQAADTEAKALADLSLEELMNIEVTTVAKKSQKVSEAAAAVFVITQEDIRRSGATSIPEVLRMVPGLQVARSDSNDWAVSARGFDEAYSTKLLVLIDGRSTYNSFFSGVHWDVEDTLLEDIERIEVVRGPGSTLWGANAVNGVINIITKNAQDTQGTMAVLGYGTEERGFGSVRYGDRIGENCYYRTFVKFFNRDDSYLPSGGDLNDDWDMWRGGFRLDRSGPGGDELTLQGEVYDGDIGEKVPLPMEGSPYSLLSEDDQHVYGGYLLARFSKTVSSFSDYTLQLYHDYSDRDSLLTRERDYVSDIDFQYRFSIAPAHEIIWGLGYRLLLDDIASTDYVSADPEKGQNQLFSAFLQDEITLVAERLYMMAGSKIEHNDFSGFEVQPNLRMLFTPTTRHTLWMSVARAVRTPSRAEQDAQFSAALVGPDSPVNPFDFPIQVVATGSEDFKSETVIAYEAGFRSRLNRWLSIDVATFYNVYDDLRNAELEGLELDSVSRDRVLVFVEEDNNAEGQSYGVECVADLQLKNWWKMQAAYSYLSINIDLDDDNPVDDVFEGQEGWAPRHQVSLRSMMNLPAGFEWDWWIRSVDELENLGVDSYVELDTRLSWRPNDAVEFSLVGQNLLDSHHPEFTDFSSIFTGSQEVAEVERGMYGKIVWHY